MCVLVTGLWTGVQLPDSYCCDDAMMRSRRCGTAFWAIFLPPLLASCAVGAGVPTPSPSESATNAVYGGCADLDLQERIQGWAGKRGTVVQATVRLTGRTTNTENGTFVELTIDHPSTIAGPAVSIKSGWVAGGMGPDGRARTTRGTEGALWAPDGASVLVVNPDRLISSDPVQVQLQIAPIVGADVIFSNAGCWGDKGSETAPFSGRLSEVAGSQTLDAVRSSLRAYPFTKLVAVAKAALTR